MGEVSKTEISEENLRNVWELHDIRELRFGTLVSALHCYSGDKKQNTDFFQITRFKESKNMAAGKNNFL